MALTFRTVQAADGTGVTTYDTGPVAIGAAGADRWVIALVAVTPHNAADFTLTIGGVAATLIGTPQTSSGCFFRCYIANVPTGTTAVLSFASSPSVGDAFYDVDYAVWTEDAGEPTFSDDGFSGTPASNAWAVAIDVPGDGFALAISRDNFSSRTVTWAGLVEDGEAGSRMFTAASDDEMGAETGRTITATASGGVVNYQDGLYAVSFAAPATGDTVPPAAPTGLSAIIL